MWNVWNAMNIPEPSGRFFGGTTLKCNKITWNGICVECNEPSRTFRKVPEPSGRFRKVPEPSGTFRNLLWGNVITVTKCNKNNTTQHKPYNAIPGAPTKIECSSPEPSGRFRNLPECSCIQRKLRRFRKVPEGSGTFRKLLECSCIQLIHDY